MSASLITLRIEAETDLVRLRQVATALTDALDFGTFARTRVVTALIELARNALEYAGGGRVRLGLATEDEALALTAIISDQGPGIDALEEIIRGDEIRSSGLGLGLRGVRRIADSFDIATGPEGTRVDVAFRIAAPPGARPKLEAVLSETLDRLRQEDPAARMAEQNRELLAAVQERDLLMQEVHHRTGNNLALISSLIRMSASAARTDETREVLNDLGTRVQAVIQAHEQMQHAQSGDLIPALPFLRGIAGTAERAFNAERLKVAVRVTGDDFAVRGKTAVDLGLIVGELITNAFKHAFGGRETGRIEIELTQTEEGACLRVADDGHGLPQGAERPERAQSLGWRLIRSMARQYGGTIEVEGNGGLTVTIRFVDDQFRRFPDPASED